MPVKLQAYAFPTVHSVTLLRRSCKLSNNSLFSGILEIIGTIGGEAEEWWVVTSHRDLISEHRGVLREGLIEHCHMIDLVWRQVAESEIEIGMRSLDPGKALECTCVVMFIWIFVPGKYVIVITFWFCVIFIIDILWFDTVIHSLAGIFY